MPKAKIKKNSKEGKSVINENWDIEPIEDIDDFRKVVEHYSSETRKSAKKRGNLSGNKLLKRKKDTSIQLSNESEIKDFFEELISFLSRIPPLIQIRKNNTTVNIDNGKGRPSDDPNDPPGPNGANLTITNVINIDINIGGKK